VRPENQNFLGFCSGRHERHLAGATISCRRTGVSVVLGSESRVVRRAGAGDGPGRPGRARRARRSASERAGRRRARRRGEGERRGRRDGRGGGLDQRPGPAAHGGMGRLFSGVRAPSTLGTFLRAIRFGHVRQLDAVASRVVSGLAGRRRCGASGLVIVRETSGRPVEQPRPHPTRTNSEINYERSAWPRCIRAWELSVRRAMAFHLME
jgi:hypothetical protein